jgi:TatD DNase family protein
MRLFDTHAHLLDDQFELDRNALIASFPAAGVAGFVEACVEANDIPKIQGLTLLYDTVFGSAGIHPHSASTADNSTAARRARAGAEEIVARRRNRPDYHYDYSPREAQREAFANQLDLAVQTKKPVIVHDREAHGRAEHALRAARAIGRRAALLLRQL